MPMNVTSARKSMLRLSELVDRHESEDQATITAIAVLLSPLFADRSDARATARSVADLVTYGILEAAERAEQPSDEAGDPTPAFWDQLVREILGILMEYAQLSAEGLWTAEDCVLYLKHVADVEMSAEEWRTRAADDEEMPAPVGHDEHGAPLWDLEDVVAWDPGEAVPVP